MKRANRPRAAKNSTIELSIRLDLPGIGHIGPGKIKLLKLIREHRSISAAARAMDMSYRRAWLLVQDLNDVFAEPVVAKWLGGTSRGGAQLTDAGERLVANYEAVVQKAAEANRGVLNEILRSAQSREVNRSSAS
jgi:molybdate transport system regulatory protein